MTIIQANEVGTYTPEHVLLSAARHCAEEGILQSSIRWRGWAEYLLNRKVDDALFEDLASMVDMAMTFERGLFDYGVHGFRTKEDAMGYYMDQADWYVGQIK